jgi:hypothetical protein
VPRVDDLPELVTHDEAAAFRRVSRNSMYELVKTGAVRSFKYGCLIRIHSSALLEGGQ